jgi:hypothetical protein
MSDQAKPIPHPPLSRAKLTRSLPQGHEFENMWEELNGASDRAAALIAAAFLDISLENSIKMRMLELSDDQSGLIFSPDKGFISGATSKARIAHALGVFGGLTLKACMDIFSIRNSFAHAAHAITFETSAIKNAVLSLKLPSNMEGRYQEIIDTHSKYMDSPRGKYTNGCVLIATLVMAHETNVYGEHNKLLKSHIEKNRGLLPPIPPEATIPPRHPFSPVSPEIP